MYTYFPKLLLDGVCIATGSLFFCSHGGNLILCTVKNISGSVDILYQGVSAAMIMPQNFISIFYGKNAHIVQTEHVARIQLTQSDCLMEV